METQIEIAGFILVFLSLIHIIFPRYFKWKEELKHLSLINRQLMTVHTFFIGLTVFLMGLLCLTSSEELVNSTLGKRICLGLAIFWFFRLYIQFFGYSVNLWRGKTFETIVHVFFSIVWCYLSTLFTLVYLG